MTFSETAKRISARIERVTKAERVVTEILDRVLKEQDIPEPNIEVDTDGNVNLVYKIKEEPKTSEVVVLAAVFPNFTNKNGTNLKIYYDDIF